MWVFSWSIAALGAPPTPDDDAVLEALTAEIEATMAAWEGEDDAPYFVGYRLVEDAQSSVTAIAGGIDRLPRVARGRRLDTFARVGSPALDSTRRLRDTERNRRSRHLGAWIPVDDDVGVLRHAIWRQTEAVVHEAREAIARVRVNRAVKVEHRQDSADFSQEAPVVDLRPRPTLDLDLTAWQPTLREASTILADEAQIVSHGVTLVAEATTEWIVNSEGTRIRQPREHLRLSMTATVTADDGMDLSLYRWTDVHDPSPLPDADALLAQVRGLRDDVLALREAPRGDPWSGPVLLRGAAAGVFVHEVIGHRVEGHRQEDEREGQTFRALVGKRVTDPAISIVDDPTLATWDGVHLNGHYAYDQEGVPAQPAVIVEDGVLRGFLLSRDPIVGFDQSNGHGRAMVGRAPVARMANTVVRTRRPFSESALRAKLRAELRRQRLPYGLLVDDLAGGFTMTGRILPNAFNIRVVRAWRVYADGRPDELVRGIDLVGTPLDALRNIVAAGRDAGVFNGYCGAESGSVPNAAVSPSLLIRTLEVQKKETDLDRPPLLPKPGVPVAGEDA